MKQCIGRDERRKKKKERRKGVERVRVVSQGQ